MVSLVAGSILCVIALAFLAGGAWALWNDRVERDGSGFVPIGTTDLRTGTYAIVGDLRGDGPGWLYGSTVLGDERVRATSQAEQPLFIGIARKDDVFRYLGGRVRDGRRLRGPGRHDPCGWGTVRSTVARVDLGGVDARHGAAGTAVDAACG